MEDYGLALRLLRIHFKYTQREIAEKVGFSHHALSKWENGVNQPDIHALRSICVLYNITTEDFFRIASGEPIEEVFQENIDRNTRRDLMDCKKCGTPAVEGAVYCHNCGERIDGKKPCPTCGKLNVQEYKFCIYCGERIDGKTVCKTCGTEHEGRYCSQCGARAKFSPKIAQKRRADNEKQYEKIMRIVALSCGLLSAFAAFVFMFFIGFEGERSIFYYFKDSFQELKEVKALLADSHFKGSVTALMYMDAITTCVIAAATMAGITTFFALTVTYSVFALLGKEKGNPIKMTVYTAFCYILGTALLYPFGAGEAVGIKIGFNGATVAGLVICSVGLAGATACTLANDWKRFTEKSFATRWICTGACVIFGVVAFLLVRGAGAEILMSGISIVEGSPGLSGATILGVFAEVYYNKPILKDEMWAVSAFSMVGTVFVLAAIVFAFMALFRNIRNTVDKKNRNGMVWSIISFACAIGALVFTILLARQAKFIITTTELSYGSVDMKIKFAPVILATVFAFVNMGIAIAAKMVSAKNKETENE
ncbi:MAG: zinc ribbon domain-containing protein [Clostridia bacterium]|nr:zinc ribbon domain-containing protein [Clostridia bacterium]